MSKMGFCKAALLAGIGWRVGSFIGETLAITGGKIVLQGCTKLEQKLKNMVESKEEEA